MLRILVLGSGAGGGVPQWNCRCPVCAIAWRDPTKVRWRTETSIAVTADGCNYVLFDAAPGLREQILATPQLRPQPGSRRGSPIAAVFLSSAEVDHVAGLLCLRESHRFDLYATRPVLDALQTPIFEVLRASVVSRRRLVPGIAEHACGLMVEPFVVPGKVALYQEGNEVSVGRETDDVVGFEVSDGHRRFCYVPGLASLPDALRARLARADLLLLDGTTYADDELVVAGLSNKTAGRMGHLAISGPGGSLDAFEAGGPARRVYIHLNNSNPALVEGSPERRTVEARGWSVAHDGLELVL